MLMGIPAVAAAIAAGVFGGASTPPKARYHVRPADPRAGQTIKLVAARAHCRCRYRWHLVNRRHRVVRRLGKGRVVRLRFRRAGTRIVRLSVRDRHGHVSRRFARIRVRPRHARPAPAPGAPPAASPAGSFAQPACSPGATQVTSASALAATVRGGRDACVTAPVGDVDLSGTRGRTIGTTGGGSLGAITLKDASGVTFRARLRSIEIRQSSGVTIASSIIGGTASDRVMDQLIFIPDGSDDVTVRDSDIGWTTADNSGNTGYGLRVYEDADRLRIERNRFHNIGGDAIQLGMDGSDAVIDRNEISYVAPPPSSDEHSDDIQVVANGPNLRITNNYLHHNGMWSPSGPHSGGSGPYIHAGNANPILFENNLVRDEDNFMQVGGLGTGGCDRSNLTFRRNTFVHNGLIWDGAPDLQWRLCGGSNNLFERNVVNNNLGNDDGFGASGTTARANLTGSQYAIDGAGTCTVAACNPAGQEPIGYRKPGDVPW